MKEITKITSVRQELEAQYKKARSAWERGVLMYADELLDNVYDGQVTERALLNGADNWKQYSYDGNSLIYNEEICHRLCAPWEIKRKRGSDLPPNRQESWLDVQARALYQAARLIMKINNKMK